MITIQHQQSQFDLHIRLSTAGLHRIGVYILAMFDFSDVRAVREAQAEIIHDLRLDLRKMN